MAHDDDDLVEAAQQQFKTLNAARMRAQADLAEARSEANSYAIAEHLQTIANLDNAASNLTNLAQRHMQASQPKQQKVFTQSERIERFGKTDNPDWRDALAVINHGRSQPLSEQEYLEGYRRMMDVRSKRGVEQK